MTTTDTEFQVWSQTSDGTPLAELYAGPSARERDVAVSRLIACLADPASRVRQIRIVEIRDAHLPYRERRPAVQTVLAA